MIRVQPHKRLGKKEVGQTCHMHDRTRKRSRRRQLRVLESFVISGCHEKDGTEVGWPGGCDDSQAIESQERWPKKEH